MVSEVIQVWLQNQIDKFQKNTIKFESKNICYVPAPKIILKWSLKLMDFPETMQL